MGYQSWLESVLRLKRGVKKRFLEELDFQKTHCDSQTWDVLLYEMVRLKGRRLIYDDLWSAWEGSVSFASFLSGFVEEGTLKFVGEDGKSWGFKFDGRGNVFPILWNEEVCNEPIVRADDVRLSRIPGDAL